MRRMHEVDGKKYKKETDKASNIIDDSESDSVDNLDGEESPTEIELKENNAKQLTTEILLDQVDTFPKTELQVGISDAYVSQERNDSTITSPKTELHVGISDAYVLQEPDDSTVESDSIDQIITEKELEIFKDAKNENMKNIFEFINVLPNNNTPTLVSGKLILTIHLVIFLSMSMNF